MSTLTLNSNFKKIAVCGSNSLCSLDILGIAENIGSEIAKHNGVLLCGGMGGVMEAASRGAKMFDGVTVGILPGDTESESNKYIDIHIPTSLGKLRNFFVVSLADVVIGIAGGWGTLSELSLAMNLNKPVILIRNTGGVVDWLYSNQNLSLGSTFYVADNAKDAIILAFSND